MMLTIILPTAAMLVISITARIKKGRGTTLSLKPITRLERILAGENEKPITRLEYFIKKAMSGGGGDVSGKADKNNPVFTGSISMGRTGNRGFNSVAVGLQVEASEPYSHAEGGLTVASGKYSHSEGDNTTASGEGSHAEGVSTTASGKHAHAEGDHTTASKPASHAEGLYTTASKPASHAEGYYTTASGLHQHVEGRYNVVDNDNRYLHIAGNGKVNALQDPTLSNAHTLDWDGNAWFAGNVKVGGTSYDDPNAVTLGAGAVVIDDALDAVSTNPVQNSAITAALSAKADKNSPTFTGSISLGRAGNTGPSSCAVGRSVTASHMHSHAEGNETVAQAVGAHAEGCGTIANTAYQHVEGMYNVEDTNDAYVHIIGNGEKENGVVTRSNAHTLDWDGNAWFAGNVKVGGTGYSDPNAVLLGTDNGIARFSIFDCSNGATGEITCTANRSQSDVVQIIGEGELPVKVDVTVWDNGAYLFYRVLRVELGSSDSVVITCNDGTSTVVYSWNANGSVTTT